MLGFGVEGVGILGKKKRRLRVPTHIFEEHLPGGASGLVMNYLALRTPTESSRFDAYNGKIRPQPYTILLDF